ncbi:MAG: ABC transporter permease [Pseudomonadota bacterium]
MNYPRLIFASLLHRKTRTLLTLASIVAAFLLFGLLDDVRRALTHGMQVAESAYRLQTQARLSITTPLPHALEARIRTVPGVADVAYANWFGGFYQDPRNQIFTVAASPNYLDLYPEISVSPEEREAFAKDPNGILAGETVVKKYGWKVGQRIPLQSLIFPDRKGSKSWTFNLVGVMKLEDPKAAQSEMIVLHWKTFDDTTPYNQGLVGWYISRIADLDETSRIGRAIDAISANSDHETRTTTEQAAAQGWLKQLVNINMIVFPIIGAVFFTLTIVIGNIMMQSARERTSEFAVMKTIGFSRTRIFWLVIGEAVGLLVVGAAIGLMLSALIGAVLPGMIGGGFAFAGARPLTWGAGIGLAAALGVVIGGLPAYRAVRIRIVDALGKH